MAPPDESEGVVHIDTRQMLDLSDVLRQYLLTERAAQDCSAAAIAGDSARSAERDLNVEKCKCDDVPAIDPRWGALADLFF